MKMQFLVAGALLLSASAFAQVTPPLTPQTEPSGYDLLVQAGKTILPGLNGSPSASEKLDPDENLKRQRLAVERNAPALALVRQALQKPIDIPLSTDIIDPGFRVSSKVRELARQFFQESDVRVADGNFAGAMNSRLDTVEMGVGYENGRLLSMLTGTAIESIGRKDIEKIASHLDANQCRAAIARLKAIEEKRPAYAHVIQQAQAQDQILVASTLAGTQQQVLTAEGRADADMTQAEADLVAKLTPEKFKEDIAAVFTPIIQNAALPYQQSLALRVEPSSNPLLKQSAEIFVGGNLRFNYERSRNANLLLVSALELRAQKLEAGAYPDTLTTPVDPFSPDAKPLVYKKMEQGYLLYSVGPDGKDNNGAEIKTVLQGAEPGNETVNTQLTPESTGDIVQESF